MSLSTTTVLIPSPIISFAIQAAGTMALTALAVRLSLILRRPTIKHGMTRRGFRLRRRPSQRPQMPLLNSQVRLLLRAPAHLGTLRSVVTGSAIYVYGILPSSTNPITNVDILFYIDDEQAGAFQSATTYKNAYSYNFPLYSNDSLSYATHTFRLQNGRVGGDLSVVLLDYIVYSTYAR